VREFQLRKTREGMSTPDGSKKVAQENFSGEGRWTQKPWEGEGRGRPGGPFKRNETLLLRGTAKGGVHGFGEPGGGPILDV